MLEKETEMIKDSSRHTDQRVHIQISQVVIKFHRFTWTGSVTGFRRSFVNI